MDRVVAARKLIGELVTASHIKVRRVEIVGRDLAKLVDDLDRPPTGVELGEWLEEQAQVTDLTAPASLLEELARRHFLFPEVSATAARNADLEREIREATTPEPYLVYADWLQEQQDPLGELIAISVAMDADGKTEKFDRHLRRHERYFLGGVHLAGISLAWRYGFVHAITSWSQPELEVWEQLFALRVCELVESIRLLGTFSAAQHAAIAAAAPPTLRAVTLDHAEGVLPPSLLKLPLRSFTIGSAYSIQLEQHTLPPTLERLVLRVRGIDAFVPIELHVRELDIAASEALLGKLSLTNVQRLTLWLGGVTASNVPAILERIQLPALTHLTLSDGHLDLATVEAIAKLPLATQLVGLGLVGLGLTDQTIAPIAAVSGFSSLAEIDVTDNELAREGIEHARKLAPTVTTARQHRPGTRMEKRVRKLAGPIVKEALAIAEPSAWRRAGTDGDIWWGRFREEADFELFISTDLSRYGCMCPDATASRHPCKHVIALALVGVRSSLPPAPSRGIETRVVTRATLSELLVASLDDDR